jgi:hypothetical protein
VLYFEDSFIGEAYVSQKEQDAICLCLVTVISFDGLIEGFFPDGKVFT